MTGFAEKFDAARRQFILRLLVEIGGQANESVLMSAARRGGFEATPFSELRIDLDKLAKLGCVAEDWIDSLRVVKITDLGEDAAHGRVSLEGVEAMPWRRT